MSIQEQTLRNLLPNLLDNEIKADLKKHEGKMLLRFHSCQVLINKIEPVVRDITNMWKNIYHLHEPSKNIVEIKDIDSSDEEDETLDITINVDDYEELMKEDDKENEEEAEKEEDDPIKIAAQVMASLPHSPPKLDTLQTCSSNVILATTDTILVGSLFATSQLLSTNMEVSTTSSIELQMSSSTVAIYDASTSTTLPFSATSCIVSLPSCSTISTTSDLSLVLVSSSMPACVTPICVTPVVTTPTIATSVLDSIINIPSNVSSQVSSAGATISTIVSTPPPKVTISEA
jgi:hypothetical protein